MKTMLRGIGLASLLFFAAGNALAQRAYIFDAVKSTLEINVYKEGLFKVFAHDHLVAAKEFSGTVQFDEQKLENSSVRFRAAAKSLTAVDPGESEKDRTQVQSTMLGESVLDATRYPEIAFHSTGVTLTDKQGDTWRIRLEGTLLLHGVEKPLTVPLTLRVSSDGLTAEGEVFLLQTNYGITPVRFGGGTVKVKDRIRIHFQIHARAWAKP